MLYQPSTAYLQHCNILIFHLNETGFVKVGKLHLAEHLYTFTDPIGVLKKHVVQIPPV